MLSSKLLLLHSAKCNKRQSCRAAYKEYSLDLCVQGCFIVIVLLFNSIHTVWNLRGSGIWEKYYSTVHTGSGRRNDSKKRMSRYAEEHPGEQAPGCTKSSLTFPRDRQATPSFSPHLIFATKSTSNRPCQCPNNSAS